MTLADRAAAVSMLWRRVCEVFPYFDTLELDWDSLYRKYLELTLSAEGETEFHPLLMEFMNLLGDGHTGYTPPRSLLNARGTLPFKLSHCAEGYYISSVERGGEEQLFGLVRGINGENIDGILRRAGRYCYSVEGYISPTGLATVLPFLVRERGNELETDRGIFRFDLSHESPDMARVPTPGCGEDFKPVDSERLDIRLYDGGVLYIRLNDLQHAGAASEVEAALRRSGPSGVILDLRGNVGGMTFNGAKIAELFISGQFHGCKKRTRVMEGVELAGASQFAAMSGEEIRRMVSEGITTEAEAEESQKLWKMRAFQEYEDSFGAPGQKSLYGGPCVLMISRGTVSAAEDMTAMFKTNHRAALLGTPTYGSTGTPLIQSVPGGGRGRVCSVGYKLLDGTEFIRRGIEPDLPANAHIADLVRGVDVPLQTALSLLR